MAPSDRIETTKAGERDDTIVAGKVNPEWAFVKDLLVDIHANATARGSDPLFPNVNEVTYNRELRLRAEKVGLSKLKVSAHLARHGGPSTDTMEELLDPPAI